MEDLINIWNAEDELNEEQLMNYINNTSSNEEQYTIEAAMNNSSFINDAVEGLQQFSSTTKMNTYVRQINEHLHHRLNEKERKRKLSTPNLSWQIIAVIIIIVLCIIGYVVIEMQKK